MGWFETRSHTCQVEKSLLSFSSKILERTHFQRHPVLNLTKFGSKMNDHYFLKAQTQIKQHLGILNLGLVRQDLRNFTLS